MRLCLLLLLRFAAATTIVVKRHGVYQWRSNLNGYTIGVPVDTPCTRHTYVSVNLLTELEEDGFVSTSDVDITESDFVIATVAYVNGGCKLVYQLDSDDTVAPDIAELVAPYGFGDAALPVANTAVNAFYAHVILGILGTALLIASALWGASRCRRS